MKPIMIIADTEGRRQVALKRGMQLAAAMGSPVEVVGFVYEYLTELSAGVQKELKNQLLVEKQAWLEAEVARQAPAGLKIKVRVIWQKTVHLWVNKRCASRDYFAVVKTAHRTGNFAYTSTDWHLLRSCPAPVLIEAEKKWNKSRPVVASLDLGTKRAAKRKLNDRIMERAVAVAEATGSDLEVIYAITVPTLLKDMDIIDVDEYTFKRREELKPVIKKLCEKYGLRRRQVHLKTGSPRKIIPSLANKLKADLIVMGTLGRKGIRGKLMGNTAEQVLEHLRTDVLAIK